MMNTKAPLIRILSSDENDAILTRNHVGRLAYSLHDRVDIEPMHYVYADGVLYGRTSPGSKLTTLAHRPWVAFEVDEVEGLYDWRSVVVRGALYSVEDGDGATEHAAYAHALRRLRELASKALLEGDMTPFRSVIFRIHVESVTGREARQSRHASERPAAAARSIAPADFEASTPSFRESGGAESGDRTSADRWPGWQR